MIFFDQLYIGHFTIKNKTVLSIVEGGDSRIINYQYDDSIYFGKGHNIPTGSDVRLNNGTSFTEFGDNVNWNTG